MDSDNSGRSENLVELAQRLRLHNRNSDLDSINAKDFNFPDAELVSQEGIKSSRAAVLICLFEDDNGDLRVILTKRSSKLSSHSGEVALPGGKRDESDANDVETALREAKEEIGLDPSFVEVVTVLEPFTNKEFVVSANRSRKLIKFGKRLLEKFPVIGILWDKRVFNPVLSATEVESIFDAPLEMFLKDENRRQEEREWMDYKYLLHFFDHHYEDKSYVIWAITAGILIKAASIIYQRAPAFEERKPKFWSRQ
ncbi:nudix hydrolase 15 mitochondrial [Phtheirospermum japonicum]|uniref:Nudix hydrolase 15 mitochondrial n=1 Tax=Phtheirospermum japonicum TaxID=374723 RepID=A0A830B560_9LAMI|nr:nudix hydrolase 15 mitochondrial [Phtheirospermum japonicum]